MNVLSIPLTDLQRTSIADLFDRKGPVLLEVRFPRMATSPDWFLCEAIADFDAVYDRLGPGAELILNSVWDLKSASAPLVFSR